MAEKILVVDDDPDTRKFLALFLKSQGYEPLTAADGMTALQMAHEQKPDLIILDVMMQGMDGFDVARNLRRAPDTAVIPLLMFTAKSHVQDKLAGYESGVDIYLTKPAHPVELQANIKALLSQRKARQENLVKRGYIVGVIAAKGGLGASTVALNLAIAFTRSVKKKVIAVETRPGQGTWREELGVTSPTGLENLLQMAPGDIVPQTVEKQLVVTNFGVPLLLASNEAHNEICNDALEQYSAILTSVSHLAELVMVDIGTPFHPGYDSFTKLCDEIILVTEPQPLTVRRTRHLVSELRNRDYGSARPLTIVTVNRTRSEMTMPLSKMEDVLGHNVTLGFTPATELAYLSVERSAPMMIVQPEGLIARQFDTLAEQIARHIQ
jgi:CheY-like chemotaxis protein/MinD-like ATPase involved in chromosome partitioning or flagellar assembly